MTDEDRRKKKADRHREWSAANPDKVAANRLRHSYGITKEQFDEMLTEQNSACAVCGTADAGRYGTFNVDHCHTTKRVRGLLGHHCNVGLGHFKDNPAALRRAASYLEGSHVH